MARFRSGTMDMSSASLPPPSSGAHVSVNESGMTDLHLGMFLFFTLVFFCCVVGVMGAYGFTQLAREMRKRELSLAFKEGREEQRKREEEEMRTRAPLFPGKLTSVVLGK